VAAGAVPSATPPVLVGASVNVAKGVTVGIGVFEGAASAVRVKFAENVATACVLIWFGAAVIVIAKSSGIPPQALSNKVPIINVISIPPINRNLSIVSPFHKRRYFTWILIFVQLVFDQSHTNSCFTDVL
jgi:hypothetical protein